MTEAIEMAAITFPPFQTDTWPCLSSADRAAAPVSARGRNRVRPAQLDQGREEEAGQAVLRVAVRLPIDDADHRDLLDQFLWFGTDYGPGDPLRWSPVAVEILLADWIPRKIVASPEHLSKAPGLLRAFIRFCHAERGIRAALTDETLGRGRRIGAGVSAGHPLAPAAGTDGAARCDGRARR